MGTALDRGGSRDRAAYGPVVKRSSAELQADREAVPAAWRSRAAWVVLLLVTVVGLGIDLATKSLAFQSLGPYPVLIERDRVIQTRDLGVLIPPGSRREVIPGLFDLTLVLNPGAVFGMGAGKRVYFIFFTVGSVAFALWMFATWTTSRERASHVAIGLILAGGLGNLYDRLVYACVRDFLHPLPGVMLPFGWSWPWGGREVWPYVSNVADLWLLVGIAILMVQMLRVGAHAEGTRRPQSTAEH
ncbi:MAG: signal peptidase II [Phycisphaeraceae bacterium]|nr:signal peptidase II [Phycisphaeraceae bacterium]